MIEEILYRIDGIKWKVYPMVIPFCPKHHLELYGEPHSYQLRCEECKVPYELPRSFQREKRYVHDKVHSKRVGTLQTINLDDEAVPLAKSEIKPSVDNPNWVEAKLVESRTGKRLVIYAGDRNKKNKTQIFVEPEIKRLSFDHKDHHPSEVFLEVEAKFADGTKSSMTGTKQDKN